jgi:uncharacterized protein (DUF885 family)
MKTKFKLMFLVILGLSGYTVNSQQTISFEKYVQDFVSSFQKLQIPDAAYDYRDYFNSIPSSQELRKQNEFFNKYSSSLRSYERSTLNLSDKIIYDQLLYEITFNLKRVDLELAWDSMGRQIPAAGLSQLEDHAGYYQYFIQKFTSVNMTPEEVMKLGESEVRRVKDEIRKLQITSGKDSASFYQYLKNSSFFITDKSILIERFHKTDSIIRSNLKWFLGDINVPVIYPMEWPGAGGNTPPGIYLPTRDNPYGKDVFQYNFFQNKYNSRAIDWLYIHEGIPGHHLQFSFGDHVMNDPLKDLFMYPGNFEGWACYVEYEGKPLGVYKDLYSLVGKWEWDLVRSARLCIDAGIHYYGWTHEQAIDYWKKTIPGQDEIAEREVTRVINWPGQALSYKVGADRIMKMKEKIRAVEGINFNEAKFNQCFLYIGSRPLEVIQNNFDELYASYKLK